MHKNTTTALRKNVNHILLMVFLWGGGFFLGGSLNEQSWNPSALLPKGQSIKITLRQTEELDQDFKPKVVVLFRWSNGFTYTPLENIPEGEWKQRVLDASKKGVPIKL